VVGEKMAQIRTAWSGEMDGKAFLFFLFGEEGVWPFDRLYEAQSLNNGAPQLLGQFLQKKKRKVVWQFLASAISHCSKKKSGVLVEATVDL
jgi:hypothetical protein